jgi:hypothetical protein
MREQSWGENPLTVVPIIQVCCVSNCLFITNTQSTVRSMQHDKSQMKSKHADTADETIAKMQSPLTDTKRRLLRWVIPLARRAVGNREQTKVCCAVGIEIIRTIAFISQ